MAKADIKITPVVNSTKSEELKASNGADVKQDESKLTANANANSENVQKTEESKASKVKSGTVVVQYLGNSAWIDACGNIWGSANIDGTNIRADRTFTKSELDEREDIKFMIGYGEMRVLGE